MVPVEGLEPTLSLKKRILNTCLLGFFSRKQSRFRAYLLKLPTNSPCANQLSEQVPGIAILFIATFASICQTVRVETNVVCLGSLSRQDVTSIMMHQVANEKIVVFEVFFTVHLDILADPQLARD